MHRRCADRSVYDMIKVLQEQLKSIKSHLLSNRSRGTLMSYADRSAQHQCISNKLTLCTMATIGFFSGVKGVNVQFG